MKALEQVAPIETERQAVAIGRHVLVELDRVTPDGVSGNPDPGRSLAHHRLASERSPKLEDKLVQRVPGVLVVQIGPEEGEHGIPPMKTAKRVEEQIRKDGELLRLEGHGSVSACLRPDEAESATGGSLAVTLDVLYDLGLSTIDDTSNPDDVKNRAWSILAGVSFPVGQ